MATLASSRIDVRVQQIAVALVPLSAVPSPPSSQTACGTDGIDIDIERFPNGVGSKYQSLIGQLITTLKNHGVIRFVSMAPGYSTVSWRGTVHGSVQIKLQQLH